MFEKSRFLSFVAASLLIGSAARGELAAALLATTPGVERRLVVDGPLAGHEGYEQAIAAHPPRPIADEREGAPMLYSSGTTGHPKGIIPPRAEVPFGTPPVVAALNQRLYGFDPGSVYLSPAPLYHSAPLNFCMMVQRLGGTVVVMERFDALQAKLAAQHFAGMKHPRVIGQRQPDARRAHACECPLEAGLTTIWNSRS